MSPSLTFTLCLLSLSLSTHAYDVRSHLTTKTGYLYRSPIPNAPSIHEIGDPKGYEATYIYLLSRHGSRWPTKDRMAQINDLESVFKDASNTRDLPWIRDWRSPLRELDEAEGELHKNGEDEMWSLATRLRERFPGLVAQQYLPKVYPIRSTSVSRAAASASAFASAYFPRVATITPARGQAAAEPVAQPFLPIAAQRRLLASSSSAAGALSAAIPLRQQMLHRDGVSQGKNKGDSWRPQAVAVSMTPKRMDDLLRFFDVCPAYKHLNRATNKWMGPWMAGNWSALVPRLEQRLGMRRPLRACDVDALWQLCSLEAGISDVTDQACALFQREEALVLEWLEDVHLLETESYGAALNYEIAAPLLDDMLTSLKAAVHQKRSHAQHAKLLFAHCETLVPLATRMGLFWPDAPDGHRGATQASRRLVSKAAGEGHHALLHSGREVPLSAAAAAAEDDWTDDGEDLEQVLGEGAEAPSCYLEQPEGTQAFKPPPPGWEPPFSADESRLWRGSRIAPFGGNLAVVLYHKVGTHNSVNNHRVRLLYNEQVMEIPGIQACSPTGRDYEFKDFLDVMRPLAGDGTLDDMCRMDDNFQPYGADVPTR